MRQQSACFLTCLHAAPPPPCARGSNAREHFPLLVSPSPPRADRQGAHSRVRLLLRICDKAELSDDQLELLRELNYEAHRTALLCFVSLCKKYGTQPAIAEPAPLRESEGAAAADDSDEEDQEGAEDSNDDSRRVSAEFRMAICNGDVWRTITSYT